MNILVIGNGFDIAHDLPTKYTDFLLFCDMILKLIKENHCENLIPRNDEKYKKWVNECDNLPLKKIEFINKSFCSEWIVGMSEEDRTVCEKMFYSDFGKNFLRNNPQLVKELYYLIYKNNWIEYFLQCNMHGKENWINFESEISKVIQSINKGINENDPEDVYSNILCLGNKFFNDKFTNNVPEYLHASAEEQKKIEKPEISYKELRDILLADLNKLIRAFEIYLTEYVEGIDIQEKSPDIKDLKIDHVLSFNYTNTYENQYDNSKNIEYDYIHGKADVNNTIETNNIVLGIDEYLKDNRKNKDIEFIAFKKYYQRIYKGTGSKYKDWINAIREENDIYMERKHDCEAFLKNGYGLTNEIEERRAELKRLNENSPRHNLYIFGHSLDITDKDVLRDLILNDNVYTTIYYPDKEELGRKIANLVKVIGQKELIRRTGGNTKTIAFEPQQKMEPIKSQQSEENHI